MYISDEHLVVPTGIYYREFDFRQIKDPFNHSWKIH